MTAYEIKFKTSIRTSRVSTWTRFATGLAEATEQALQALYREYSGQAILISVEAT